MEISRRGVLLVPTILGAGSLLTSTSPLYAQPNHSMLTNPTGVALAVKDEYTFLTNKHSLNQRGEIEFFNPQIDEAFSPRSVSTPYETLDVAIHELQQPQQLFEPIKVSETPMQLNTPYQVILGNQEYNIEVREKRIIDEQNQRYEVYIGTALPIDAIFRGRSGSPVIDPNTRELVAIVTGEDNRVIEHNGEYYQTAIYTNLGGLERLM